MKKKVMLGMSGGVDSSVSALLLLQQGYDVTGVTMKLRPDQYMAESQSGGCCSLDDIDDARRVAYRLGIEHLVLNFTQVFSEKVIDYFASEYLAGRTPNPCIACNAHVKFDALLRKALSLEYDYVATGHYAVITQNDEGRWLLKKAPCSKDQSYVLYHLTQHQLAHTLMPLAGMEKSEARELAREAGLPVAHKPDSQEICFVQDNDYASFIRRYTGKEPTPGNFIDQAGNVLGTHKGITHYTIGQRKGLGVAMAHPVYVTGVDAVNNIVHLGEAEDLTATALTANDWIWSAPADRMEAELDADGIRVGAKYRYRQKDQAATLTRGADGQMLLTFDEPQRAIAPGQAVVIYRGDVVLGGGTVTAAIK